MTKKIIPGMPKLLPRSHISQIRGKASVGHHTQQEVMQLLGHILAIEEKLDSADYDDFFGTEGWRHWMGVPE